MMLEEYTTWIAIQFKRNCGDIDELFEHLAMNGYTYDVAFSNEGVITLFVNEKEFAYVLTIINDRNITYTIL